MKTSSVLGPPSIQLDALRIWVHGYQFPDATDEWDGNWLRVTARCAAPGATVEVSGSILDTVGFLQFQRELVTVYERLQGEATLESHEPELKVQVRGVVGGQTTSASTPSKTVEMNRRAHRRILVSCLVAMMGLATELAGASGESPGTVAAGQQNPGRPPDAVLRSAAEQDFPSVVRDILVAAGEPRIAIRVRPTASAKTAGASVAGGHRTIEYNPEFIERLVQRAGTGWAAVLVLSHEVAHLVAGHATPRPTSQDDLRSMEREADRAAGFILARLGATLVESSRSIRAACQLEQIDETVCTVYEGAIEVGWRAGMLPPDKRLQPSASALFSR